MLHTMQDEALLKHFFCRQRAVGLRDARHHSTANITLKCAPSGQVSTMMSVLNSECLTELAGLRKQACWRDFTALDSGTCTCSLMLQHIELIMPQVFREAAAHQARADYIRCHDFNLIGFMLGSSAWPGSFSEPRTLDRPYMWYHRPGTSGVALQSVLQVPDAVLH